ncbi:MAG: hypothetical protein ABSE45_02335 [Candidatus Acidiferrales bacterium]|jgi:type IV secretory pathway component VirB8
MDPKEETPARKAAREMKTAALVITLSFVFVLVAVALIVILGHIQLF